MTAFSSSRLNAFLICAKFLGLALGYLCSESPYDYSMVNEFAGTGFAKTFPDLFDLPPMQIQLVFNRGGEQMIAAGRH